MHACIRNRVTLRIGSTRAGGVFELLRVHIRLINRICARAHKRIARGKHNICGRNDNGTNRRHHVTAQRWNQRITDGNAGYRLIACVRRGDCIGQNIIQRRGGVACIGHVLHNCQLGIVHKWNANRGLGRQNRRWHSARCSVSCLRSRVVGDGFSVQIILRQRVGDVTEERRRRAAGGGQRRRAIRDAWLTGKTVANLVVIDRDRFNQANIALIGNRIAVGDGISC